MPQGPKIIRPRHMEREGEGRIPRMQETSGRRGIRSMRTKVVSERTRMHDLASCTELHLQKIFLYR